MKKKVTILDILFLQFVMILYTGSSIAAKFAAGSALLSPRFLLCYGAEIAILGIYAILWQQVIKKMELSVAYANRAMVLVWSMLWAVLIFGDRITWKNAAGVLLIVAGTVVMNLETRRETA